MQTRRFCDSSLLNMLTAVGVLREKERTAVILASMGGRLCSRKIEAVSGRRGFPGAVIAALGAGAVPCACKHVNVGS